MTTAKTDRYYNKSWLKLQNDRREYMFIDIKDARKHYGEGETLVNALDGVSLSLGEGRIYVILGPSGTSLSR